MGWARTLLLGDIGNRLDIEDTENEIRRIKKMFRGVLRKDKSHDRQLIDLQKENLELKLYLASLIRLLIHKQAFTEDEFRRFVDIIDEEDGDKDGMYTDSIV